MQSKVSKNLKNDLICYLLHAKHIISISSNIKAPSFKKESEMQKVTCVLVKFPFHILKDIPYFRDLAFY